MNEISIIIPAYNRSNCILRALKSVSIQEINELELLLGDDASTDGTVACALGVFPDLLSIRLEKNSGAAAARNAALKIAKGKFIAFLDSDDEWLPGKLRAQLDFLEANPDVAVCATAHVFKRRDGVEKTVIVDNWVEWKRRLHEGLPFHGASTPVVRREVLESVGLQDEALRVLEDWDWMLRIAQKHRIHVLPDPLAVIHENGPSDPDFTHVSTERFLEKHKADFCSFGRRHFQKMASQHWENAARCFFRHSRNTDGIKCVIKSLSFSVTRNPWLAVAIPLACVDGLFGSKLLRKAIAHRSGISIV
jgi:glycosyltransferase involved in cell wall biosynthesis